MVFGKKQFNPFRIEKGFRCKNPILNQSLKNTFTKALRLTKTPLMTCGTVVLVYINTMTTNLYFNFNFYD